MPDQKKEPIADIANEHSQTAPGNFKWTRSASPAILCRETAPADFTRHEDGGNTPMFLDRQHPRRKKLKTSMKPLAITVGKAQ